MTITKNKLSIYLIKDKYLFHKDILKDFSDLKHEQISDTADFYYGESHINEPSWLKNFFAETIPNSKETLFNSSSKALVLISVDARIFALTFGFGYTMLLPGIFEERFGLKAALSLIDNDNLRSISKKTMSNVPKLSIEQISKDSKLEDFGIDVEQDLLQGLTGKSSNTDFGNLVSGKDSFSVSIPKNIENISPFLKKCIELYKSEGYKKNYKWIDDISGVTKQNEKDKLDGELVKRITDQNFDDIYMAVPEIIDWEKISEFRFNGKKGGDDIEIQTYIQSLSEKQKKNISIKSLKSHYINCMDTKSGTDIYKWKIYNCIYCEISKNNTTFILSNGKWYEINKDFVETVNDDYKNIINDNSTIELPPSKSGEHENMYNKRVGDDNDSICNMDRKMIHIGGARQQIEFCDLLTKKNEIIHVKRYGASSVLSHLFSQGLVSGELFLSDEGFRKKLRDKLPNGFKSKAPQKKPNAAEYEIVYAIISKYKELEIPFFSKVNMRNAVRRLKAFGYKVSLINIEIVKDEK